MVEDMEEGKRHLVKEESQEVTGKKGSRMQVNPWSGN